MVKKELTKKNTKGENTKQKIFDVSVELFEKYGLENLTVDEIVKAAGVAKGTFYIYFESKDALIATFISEYVGKIDMDYGAHIHSLPKDITSYDMLLSLIVKISDVLIDVIGYEWMRIVYKFQLEGVVDMENVNGYNRKLYQIFSYVLSRGIDSGEFRTKLTLETITKHFVMAIRGLSYEWCIRYPDFDLKKESIEHFKLLLESIEKS